MDIPTTDPGSDLIFSTDDEFIIDNGNNICRDTLPRMRKNLLQSELQRRYIEEIGDGLRTMPPELIITSPSSPLSIRYKMENSSSRLTRVVLPNIERARQVNSNHSLPENDSYNKSHHHPFHVLSTKRTELNPEDLNIALQIKKKIWAGIQPDSGLLMVDRTKNLGRESTSAKLESKTKTTNILKANSGDLLSNASLTANLPPDTKEFLAACSRKLIAWKSGNPTQERDTKSKIPLESVVSTIDEKRTMCIFRQLVNSKGLQKLDSSKIDSPYETKEGKSQNKPAVKKSSITKAVGSTKGKIRSSLRSPPSQQFSQKVGQMKSHYKKAAKTADIKTTATSRSLTNAKKQKLQKKDAPLGTAVKQNATTIDMHKVSKLNNLDATASKTSLTRKAKTKLKKKKLPMSSCSVPNDGKATNIYGYFSNDSTISIIAKPKATVMDTPASVSKF
uniref:Uncharacterized protein n=1 Tax=Glossina pallidipes TaxID=7398 RepID=A0A1B0AH99_GLOPL